MPDLNLSNIEHRVTKIETTQDLLFKIVASDIKEIKDVLKFQKFDCPKECSDDRLKMNIEIADLKAKYSRTMGILYVIGTSIVLAILNTVSEHVFGVSM